MILSSTIVIIIVILVALICIYPYLKLKSNSTQEARELPESSNIPGFLKSVDISSYRVCLGDRDTKERVRCIKFSDLYVYPPYAPWPEWTDNGNDVIIDGKIKIPKIKTMDTAFQCWPMQQGVVFLSKEDFIQLLQYLATV